MLNVIPQRYNSTYFLNYVILLLKGRHIWQQSRSHPGQIVIPSRIRKHLNIKPGMQFVVQEQGRRIIVERVDEQFFDQFAGILKGTKATEELLKERRRDKERENSKSSKS